MKKSSLAGSIILIEPKHLGSGCKPEPAVTDTHDKWRSEDLPAYRQAGATDKIKGKSILL